MVEVNGSASGTALDFGLRALTIPVGVGKSLTINAAGALIEVSGSPDRGIGDVRVSLDNIVRVDGDEPRPTATFGDRDPFSASR